MARAVFFTHRHYEHPEGNLIPDGILAIAAGCHEGLSPPKHTADDVILLQ